MECVFYTESETTIKDFLLDVSWVQHRVHFFPSSSSFSFSASAFSSYLPSSLSGFDAGYHETLQLVVGGLNDQMIDSSMPIQESQSTQKVTYQVIALFVCSRGCVLLTFSQLGAIPAKVGRHRSHHSEADVCRAIRRPAVVHPSLTAPPSRFFPACGSFSHSFALPAGGSMRSHHRERSWIYTSPYWVGGALSHPCWTPDCSRLFSKRAHRPLLFMWQENSLAFSFVPYWPLLRSVRSLMCWLLSWSMGSF